MAQKRLYYDDSYIKTFSTLISDTYYKEDRLSLVFEKTAFYPVSGGQPCDFGTIEKCPVEEVFEREDGEIVHILKEKESLEFKPGYEVNCEIDWDRRFEHMQQHTGQHILSRSFLKLYNLQTVGFHLGKDFSTIDLDASQMSLDKLYEGETYANKVIFENRPVYIRYFNEEEIEKIKLRKDLDCSGLYRIIEIKDFDLSACGGTHCNTTGEVGLIVIKGWEKLKDKFRIEFLCGLRVLKTFREYNAIFKEISWRFSVGLQDVISKMDKLTNESNENYKALKKFKEQCLNQEVELLYQNEEKNKQGITHIRRSYDDKTFEELKSLAKNVIMKFEKTIVCFATTSEPASIVIARSKDLNFNLSLFMKGFNKDFSGKGGGQPDFVQGGGYKVQDVENIFERIQESVLNCKKEDCKS